MCDISVVLEKIRLDRHLTQEALALATGIDRTTLTKYETGKRVPNLSDLRKICKALDCPSDYFLGLSESSTYNRDIQIAGNVTHLTVNALKTLQDLKALAQVTSRLLSSDAGKTALTLIGAYLQTPAGSLENLVLDLGLIELGRPLDEAIALTPEATRAALKQFCIVQLQAHLDKMREEEANE